MKLKGISDTSLGNFVCVRGFAKLRDLYEISDYDESFQRNLIDFHKQEIVNFLNDRKFLFFPEVILGVDLAKDIEFDALLRKFNEDFEAGHNFKFKFRNFSIRCSTEKTKNIEDSRTFNYFRKITLNIPKNIYSGTVKPFSRIDGNHRISAVTAQESFDSINTPYCIIIFQREIEKKEFSRVIFHNINSKSIPISLEHSTKLIIEDSLHYSDDTLKESASFGLAYYFTRKLYNSLDFQLIPYIENSFKNISSGETEYSNVLLKTFQYLIPNVSLSDHQSFISHFKSALSETNSLYGRNDSFKTCKNSGLLIAFLYYQLKTDNKAIIPAFYDWVLSNHITDINYLEADNIIKVFDKIIKCKKREIFVSMPFGKSITDNHFLIIDRVCNEISASYNLDIKIKAQRVDWFADGTSYVINDRILDMISNCGMLIGDLTYARPNVYHEIGFIMGKNKALGQLKNNFLLILNESVPDNNDKTVGFNLSGIKQIRFTRTEDLAKDLKENIIKFYGLKQ